MLFFCFFVVARARHPCYNITMKSSEIPRNLSVETHEDLMKKLDEVSTFNKEDYILAEDFWNKFDDFRHRVQAERNC